MAENRVPAPVAQATAGLFGLGSRLRGKRIFHPRGVAFEATLSVDAPGRYAGAELFAEPRTWRAVVRLSRALGLPIAVPDLLGLALRIPDAYGRERHQDFLLVTSGSMPGLQHLLLPAASGFLGRPYSSILAYRIGNETRLVRADPVTGEVRGRIELPDLEGDYPSPLTFDLTLNSFGGRRDVVGRLATGTRLTETESESLAFNPWNTGPGIRPAGPFQGLRRPAYAGSQRARGVEPQGTVVRSSQPRARARARA